MSEPSGGLMRPHNLIEDHVFDVSDRLTAADAEFCGCEKCLTDVMAFALAQIPPAYVSSEQGRAITEARLVEDDHHTAITQKVNEAIAAVKAHPRH
jgi:competence protein ComFB